jgi:hypothetical protein
VSKRQPGRPHRRQRRRRRAGQRFGHDLFNRTCSTGEAMSTTTPALSASSGSNVASWDSSNATGMKWPERPSSRAPRTFLLPCRCRKTVAVALSRMASVAPLERRTGQDEIVRTGGGKCIANRGEPRPAVLVRQRRPGSHLRQVLDGMEGIAVEERQPQPAGDEVTDGGFAAAGDPHNHNAPRRAGVDVATGAQAPASQHRP